jgi:hypothetical protein
MGDQAYPDRQMKLVAMLSWYNEPIDGLVQTVRDLRAIGVTDLVAVDGAYLLYPEGMGRSHWPQSRAIQEHTDFHGINLLMYQPCRPWVGNEVEKRQVMLNLALAITTEDDWIVPWDADWQLDEYREDMKPILNALHPRQYEWADLQITGATEDVGWYWIRQFLRARKGIHFTTNHYTYHYPDGKATVVGPLGPDLNAGYKTKLRVWHRRERRSKERLFAQDTYYQQRHIKGVES